MKEESDLIQQLSRTYGEFFSLEEFIRNINNTKLSSATRKALKDLCEVYMLSTLEADLGYLLTNEFMIPSAGRQLSELLNHKVELVGQQALTYTEGFGIPDGLLLAPIAQDWERYNESDFKGEFPLKSKY